MNTPEKPRVWRTRDVRGRVNPWLTTWNYSVPLPDRTVIGYAVDRHEAYRQVAHLLRGARTGGAR